MTLVDSSVWVELLRGTGSEAHLRLTTLLRSDAELVTTEPVSMELLAGARDRAHGRQLRGMLAVCTMVPVHGPGDWELAAAVFATCRLAGTTPRGLLDCVIAAVAIRIGAPVLARDRDFELIAEHTPLELAV